MSSSFHREERHNSHLHLLVYLLTDKPNSRRVHRLSSLFDDPFFLVKICNIPGPYHLNTNDDPSKKTYDTEKTAEAYRISKVLKKGRQNHPSFPLLILKDNSSTSSSGDNIARICREICEEPDWDLCYLCKWLDRCDLYTKIRKIEGTCFTLTQTKSPHGIQALLFSPKGRDRLLGYKPMRGGTPFPLLKKPLDTALNEQIEVGNLRALCLSPDLFSFDIHRASRLSDLAKMSICRRPEDKEREEIRILPTIWFFIITIGILLLLWGFWNLGSEKKPLGYRKERLSSAPSPRENPSRN